jgi:hypothetical protein
VKGGTAEGEPSIEKQRSITQERLEANEGMLAVESLEQPKAQVGIRNLLIDKTPAQFFSLCHWQWQDLDPALRGRDNVVKQPFLFCVARHRLERSRVGVEEGTHGPPTWFIEKSSERRQVHREAFHTVESKSRRARARSKINLGQPNARALRINLGGRTAFWVVM